MARATHFVEVVASFRDFLFLLDCAVKRLAYKQPIEHHLQNTQRKKNSDIYIYIIKAIKPYF
jgi:hypothetical protein